MTDEGTRSGAPNDPAVRGKRALYSRPTPDPAVEPEAAAPRAPGKEALYSTAQREAGTVVLECSSCGARTRVPYIEFARRHLPFWLWIPGKRHSRLMRCPACEERTWVGARWLL